MSFQTDTFQTDAFQQTGSTLGSFTADAAFFKASSGSFTANAVIVTGEARVNQMVVEAVVIGDASARVNQMVVEVVVGPLRHFTADAYIVGTRFGSLTADATLAGTREGSFKADAALSVLRSYTFAADAIKLKTQAAALTGNAAIFKALAGSFAADAFIVRPFTLQTGSFKADANLFGMRTGSFSASATVFKTLTGAFVADAIKSRTTSPAFSADAIKRTTTSPSFKADAQKFKTQAGSFVASATIFKTLTPSFSAEAWLALGAPKTGSFTASANIVGTRSGSLAADAIKKRSQTGSFVAGAIIGKTQGDWADVVLSGGTPLAWYRMRETSGDFIDSGTAARNAAVTGSPTRGATGAVDTGATFSGTGQYATTASYSLALGNTFTFETWVNPGSTGRRNVWGVNNTATVFQFEVGGNGTDRAAAYINGTFVAETNNNAITRNAWNHIVYTRSGTGSGTHKIYVNGVQKTLATDATNNYGDTATVHYIGARTTSAQLFVGTIDEIVFYSRVLTAQEVGEHYHQGRKSFTADAFIQRQFRADAVIRRSQTGSFVAGASKYRLGSGSFVARAWLTDPGRPGLVIDRFWADAVTKKTATLTFTAQAVIRKTQVEGVVSTTVSSTAPPSAYIAILGANGDTYAHLAELTTVDSYGINSGGGLYLGQGKFAGPQFQIYQGFLEFDTTSLTGATVISANLLMHSLSDNSATDFNVEVAAFDFGASVALADFRTPAQLSALTVLASRSTNPWTFGVDHTYSGVGPGVVPGDTSRYVVFSSRNRTESAPTGLEYVGYDFSGVTAPRLAITYATAKRLTADAVFVLNRVTASVTADADIKGTQTRSFAANAFIYDPAATTTFTGSLTADAIKQKTASFSFTAAADINQPKSGSFSANAAIAVTRSGSFTVDAILSKTFGSFTANALIFLGTTSGGGGGQTGGTLPTMTVAIEYDDPTLGFIDITTDVDIATAEFTSLTNGSTGLAKVRVRDEFHTYTFTTGRELTLTIDGRKFWGGFVMQAKKVYPFEAMDTTVTAETARYWELVGFDYGILFERRIVYSAANPLTKVDWTYAAGTYDDTIINDIFDHYLPGIAGDGLSRAGVERVDVAILDIPNVTTGVDASGHRNTGGSVAATGFTWRQMMDSVARSTGGVYYISPRKVLTYTDVDTPTNSYVLTDTPSLPVHVGFQKFALNYNGTDLVNDFWLWGAALGVGKMTYAHVEDAASIAEHGRWQAGNFNGGIYRQTSVNLSANTVVYGTPQNHRGHKDDAVSFTCTVFHPVFFLGQKVQVISSIYGYDDVLPIRQMRITFANPHQAVFELTLGHAIDDVWSTFESVWPKLKKPPVPGGKPKPPPPPPPGGCDAATCGITDTFTRIVDGGWGVSDAGIQWTTYTDESLGHFYSHDVVGSHAQMSVDDNGGNVYADLTFVHDANFDITFDFYFDLNGYIGGGCMVFFAMGSGPYQRYVSLAQDTALGYGWWFGVADHFPASDNPHVAIPSFIDANVWYHLRWHSEDTYQAVKLWRFGDAEPSSWTVEQNTTHALSGVYGFSIDAVSPVSGSGNIVLAFDELSITGVTRCDAVQFDDFNRTVADGWGTSTFGIPWTPWAPVRTGASLSVDGTDGLMVYADAGTVGQSVVVQCFDGPWQADTFGVVGEFSVSEVTSGLCTMRVEFIDANSASGGQLVILPSASSDVVNGIATNIWLSGAGSDPAGYKVKTDWVANARYLFRWERTTTTQRARVWAAGSAEPATWDVEVTSTFASLAGAGSSLMVTWANGGGNGVNKTSTRTLQVGYIEFDYDGKPCYQTCVTDNFSGTGLSAGWTTNIISGSPITTVGSNILRTTVAAADDGDVEYTFAASNVYDVRCRFRFVNYDAGSPGRLFIGLDGMLLRIFPSGLDNVNLSYGLSSTTNSLAALLPGTWYNLHMWTVIDAAGSVNARWWPDDEVGGENAITPLSLSGINVVAGDDFTWRVDNFLSPTDADLIVELAQLELTPSPSMDCSGVTGSVGVPTSGYVCEDLPYTTGYSYQATNSYQALSTEVWVNGLRVVRGSNGYVEFDPNAGTIVFLTPRNSSDIVRMCYQANGVAG